MRPVLSESLELISALPPADRSQLEREIVERFARRTSCPESWQQALEAESDELLRLLWLYVGRPHAGRLVRPTRSRRLMSGAGVREKRRWIAEHLAPEPIIQEIVHAVLCSIPEEKTLADMIARMRVSRRQR
jgi:hypothetical protein